MPAGAPNARDGLVAEIQGLDRRVSALESLLRSGELSLAPSLEVYGTITWPKLTPGNNGKLSVATVAYDTASYWDATNKRWNPKRQGIYQIGLFAFDVTTALAANKYWSLQVLKNKAGVGSGSEYRNLQQNTAEVGLQGGYTQLVQMNGTTDYVEAWGNTNDATAGKQATVVMTGIYLGV